MPRHSLRFLVQRHLRFAALNTRMEYEALSQGYASIIMRKERGRRKIISKAGVCMLK
ncbi:hypothetical protein M419DRAFT_126279 [Trichoderma reesei RUT C-30]|uniref:Uncharacterized protein n=1 Tax=Hypocrea jecorina (strain ATCC 56765 / BCRC 32924 / NRRL 11460 / Rut C-30) TaxID=1344414 RepID=A0A024SM15_HYPJR|nr:hypothetical protein M419DRAFT_126279 [Trichoderma reesei RUT C-30]